MKKNCVHIKMRLLIGDIQAERKPIHLTHASSKKKQKETEIGQFKWNIKNKIINQKQNISDTKQYTVHTNINTAKGH